MAAHDHGDHEHDEEEGGGCCGGGGGAAGAELDVQEQTGVFLELRKQNVELLKVAAQIAGFGGGAAPQGRGEDIRQSMDKIWNIYSELYEWIDPEEDEDEDEDEE